MDFAELVAGVQENVNRPDLQSRIESAVRTATLKCHHSNFYYKDRTESGVSFPDPDYIQNFDPKTIFPNFRKISYIRKWIYDANDAVGLGRPGKKLTLVDVDNIIDYWGCEKTDIYYQAGNLLQIKSSDKLSHILVGVYNHPVVAPVESFSSWIAEEYPDAIVFEASSKLLGQIGFTEQSKALLLDARDQLSIIQLL